MAHKLPPVQCATNTYSFTDPTLSTAIKVRKAHVDELRSQIDAELSRRGLTAAPPYTDPVIYPKSSPLKTKIRKMHVTELRDQIEEIHSGNGDTSGTGYCPEDTVTISWTDTPSTAVKVRHVHWTEMRNTLNSLKSGCICETEQCMYCADCGYKYQAFACPCQRGCYCDNSKYSSGCTWYYYYWVYDCGSINTGGTYPYKSYTPAVTWDGWVPWDWGDGIPGGAINWTSYWTCKCNPFTW